MDKKINTFVISGFGNKGIANLQAELEATDAIKTTEILSAPWYRALHHPETVISKVNADLKNVEQAPVFLIGHSYGALIALLVACRRKFSGIKGLVLVDGPLRPDIKVGPAKVAHHIFARHYGYREQIAQECFTALENLEKPPILAIAGQNDLIVPFEAKLINETMGANIVLPEEYRGHSLNPKIQILKTIIVRHILSTI